MIAEGLEALVRWPISGLTFYGTPVPTVVTGLRQRPCPPIKNARLPQFFPRDLQAVKFFPDT